MRAIPVDEADAELKAKRRQRRTAVWYFYRLEIEKRACLVAGCEEELGQGGTNNLLLRCRESGS
jgi:hypothetical protein